MIHRATVLSSFILLVLTWLPAAASDYNLLDPEDFKVRLDTGVPMILVDIQPKNAYQEHHFFGSIRTFAYPCKTDTDTQSLYQAVTLYEQTHNEVVIISPRGGRASQRAYDYLLSRGIPKKQLFILRGGIREWPYPEKLLNNRGGCG